MNHTSIIIQDQEGLEKLQQFLKDNKLPSSDLKLEGNFFIGYLDEAGQLIGSGGLEFYRNTALLRSIAVAERWRSQSLGKRIVKELVDKAKRSTIQELYLLTETAHDYFLNKGFQDVLRETLPDPIKQSTEFSQVCPASAVAMKFTIQH